MALTLVFFLDDAKKKRDVLIRMILGCVRDEFHYYRHHQHHMQSCCARASVKIEANKYSRRQANSDISIDSSFFSRSPFCWLYVCECVSVVCDSVISIVSARFILSICVCLSLFLTLQSPLNCLICIRSHSHNWNRIDSKYFDFQLTTPSCPIPSSYTLSTLIRSEWFVLHNNGLSSIARHIWIVIHLFLLTDSNHHAHTNTVFTLCIFTIIPLSVMPILLMGYNYSTRGIWILLAIHLFAQGYVWLFRIIVE